MTIDFDQLDLLGYQLVLIRAGSKAPLRKGWTEHEEPVETIEAAIQENPAMGVGVKLGGPAGIIDIEGDGPAAVRGWEDLTRGLEVPQTASWASTRGTHRLFTLTPETREIVGEKVVKSRDLEFRLGESTRYTLQSIIPPCGDREWLSPNYIVQDLPLDMARRIAAIRKAQATPLPTAPDPDDEPAEPTKPGEFYNRDANWEEILLDDGWTRTGSRKQGVSDWLRPGNSDQKLSATVNYHGDGKLHVFTSSMEGLEADTSYAPFGYLAFTKFGGDFSNASRWCADHGYGLPAPPPVDPLEGFEDLPEEDHVDPAPHIPQDLLLAPGFISEFAEYYVRSAKYKDYRMGAVGGWLLQAWMMGRKANLGGFTRSNLACLLLAESGTGKTQLVQAMKDVVRRAGKEHEFKAKFKSWQALEDNLMMSPNTLIVQEEAQDMAARLANPRDLNSKEMAENLKSMMTDACTSYQCRSGIKGSKDAAEVSSIDQPCLTTLYTAIPKRFWEVITDVQLNDGFWARFWMVEMFGLSPLNKDRVKDEALLTKLAAHVKRWTTMQVAYTDPIEPASDDETTSATLVTNELLRSRESKVLSDAYEDKCYAKRKKEIGTDDDTASSYARSGEMVARFELILSGSMMKPDGHCAVTAAVTAHAINLVRASLRFKAYRIKTRESGGGQRFDNRSAMLRWFKTREEKGKIGLSWRTANKCLNKLKGQDFSNAVMDLAQEGLIVTDGRPDPSDLRWAQRPDMMCLTKHAKHVFAKPKKS